MRNQQAHEVSIKITEALALIAKAQALMSQDDKAVRDMAKLIENLTASLAIWQELIDL